MIVKQASQLRGEGISLFRQEVAKGMNMAAEQIRSAGLDSSFILFSMWTDAIKHFAEQGKGNVIFLDGSNDNLEKTMKQMMALTHRGSEGVKTSDESPAVKS